MNLDEADIQNLVRVRVRFYASLGYDQMTDDLSSAVFVFCFVYFWIVCCRFVSVTIHEITRNGERQNCTKTVKAAGVARLYQDVRPSLCSQPKLPLH